MFGLTVLMDLPTVDLPALPRLLAAPAPGWVETTDVIVVGSGVAGLTAALHLREAGLHVTVVTKVNIVEPASGSATRRPCGCWWRRGRPGSAS